jgi:hypothetical protein
MNGGRIPPKALVAGLLAIGTIAVAAVVGWTARTDPAELSCTYVGVAIGEPTNDSIHRTPLAAAEAYADGLATIRGWAPPGPGRVIDVSDAHTAAGQLGAGGPVYAVRDRARTVALLSVGPMTWGWTVTRSLEC